MIQLSNIIYDDLSCMIIQDTSIYDRNLPVINPHYLIKQPDFTTVYKFDYEVHRSYQVLGSHFDSKCLMDGVYTIEQVICPEDKLKEKKFHLRTIGLKTSLIESMEDTCDSDEVSKKDKEIFDKLMQLDVASIYISKACSASDKNYTKGIALFKEVLSYVKKLNNECAPQGNCSNC